MKNNKEQFYIYGKNPVFELVKRKPESIIRIFVKKDFKEDKIIRLAKEKNVILNFVEEKRLREYVRVSNHQGIVASIGEFEYTDFHDFVNSLDKEKNNVVLILDHIEDTHNFGAIIRTASAVGISGIIVPSDRQAPVNSTVFKTSAGTLGIIPIVRVPNIVNAMKELKKKEFWISGLSMDGKENVWGSDLSGQVAFVVGGEGSGISRLVKENCDFLISIPMENEVESLNVSVASSVLLHEWKRQNYELGN